MPEVFVRELCHQRDLTTRRLEAARRKGDDFLADVLQQRLSELSGLAARNGVQVPGLA